MFANISAEIVQSELFQKISHLRRAASGCKAFQGVVGHVRMQSIIVDVRRCTAVGWEVGVSYPGVAHGCILMCVEHLERGPASPSFFALYSTEAQATWINVTANRERQMVSEAKEVPALAVAMIDAIYQQNQRLESRDIVSP